jgi:hypothetical protein
MMMRAKEISGHNAGDRTTLADVTATTVISVTRHRDQIMSRGIRRKNRKAERTGSRSAALLDEQPIVKNIDVCCRVI